MEEIKDHIRDSVKIKAKIYGGKFLENAKGTPTFLNVGRNYQDAPLTLVIWGNVRNQFKTHPEESFKDQTIIIYNPNQISGESPTSD